MPKTIQVIENSEVTKLSQGGIMWLTPSIGITFDKPEQKLPQLENGQNGHAKTAKGKFKCTFCPKVFSHATSMYTHRRKHHPEALKKLNQKNGKK